MHEKLKKVQTTEKFPKIKRFKTNPKNVKN